MILAVHPIFVVGLYVCLQKYKTNSSGQESSSAGCSRQPQVQIRPSRQPHLGRNQPFRRQKPKSQVYHFPANNVSWTMGHKNYVPGCFLSQQVYHFTSLPLQRVVRPEYDFLLIPSKLHHGYGCSFIDSSEYCSKSLVNFFAIVWSRAKVTVSSIKTTFLLFLFVICSDHHVRDNQVLLGTLTTEKRNPAVKSLLISESALLSSTSMSVLVVFSGFF